MRDINNKIESESGEINDERRLGERRLKQRRVLDRNYNGLERRTYDSDRRITILNRLNVEVTDRRAFN